MAGDNNTPNDGLAARIEQALAPLAGFPLDVVERAFESVYGRRRDPTHVEITGYRIEGSTVVVECTTAPRDLVVDVTLTEDA